MVFIFCCNNCPLCIAQWDSTFKIQGFVSMHTALCCIFQHMRLNLPRFGSSVELGHRWCLLRERERGQRSGKAKCNRSEQDQTREDMNVLPDAKKDRGDILMAKSTASGWYTSVYFGQIICQDAKTQTPHWIHVHKWTLSEKEKNWLLPEFVCFQTFVND